MIFFPPETPPGTLGAVLSASIVILSLAGLTMHSDFYAGIRRTDYWAYYTNQSNLLVFLYFAVVSPLLYGSASFSPLIPHAEFALTLCILLTHFVFHHFLSPFVTAETAYTPPAPDPEIARADSLIQHYAVPLTTFAYWLLCSPGKSRLTLMDAFYWLGFPGLYIGYVFVRARRRGRIYRTRSAYPYPFLDIDAFGLRRIAALLSIMLVLCAAGALALVIAVRAVFRLHSLLA